MIVININQIVANWIRSTTERLIAANAARIVGSRTNSIARPWCSKLEIPRSHRHAFCSAIPLPDPPTDRQGSTRSYSESHFPFTHKSGNIEMLLFIILALSVILTRSLIPLAATDANFTFDRSQLPGCL